jgi:hypothetical protein
VHADEALPAAEWRLGQTARRGHRRRHPLHRCVARAQLWSSGPHGALLRLGVCAPKIARWRPDVITADTHSRLLPAGICEYLLAGSRPVRPPIGVSDVPLARPRRSPPSVSNSWWLSPARLSAQTQAPPKSGVSPAFPSARALGHRPRVQRPCGSRWCARELRRQPALWPRPTPASVRSGRRSG